METVQACPLHVYFRAQYNRCESSRQGILNTTLIIKTRSFQDMADSLFLFSPIHQIDLASF